MEKIDKTGLSPEIIEYIQGLETKVETQQVRIDNLMETLAKTQKAMYGQSSEKSRYVLGENADQLSLFNEAEAETNSKAPEPTLETVATHTRKAKRTREELAENLPMVEVICDLPEAERVCDICESSLRYLGKEHVRDELEIIPAQVRVLRYIRYTYVCTECEKETDEARIVKAPTPKPIMKKSLASPSSVAHVLYQKYVNAMPLYRQEKDWANQGVLLSRVTLANWVVRSSHDWLEPVYEEMKRHLLQEAVVHADETVVQVLKEPGKSASSESRMWVYSTGNCGKVPAVLFEYQPSRSGEHARRFLTGFSGYLVTDGYIAYDKVADVTRCGCWAHVRRKFEEALPKTTNKEGSTAAIGLYYCNQLFKQEELLSELSYEEREIQRQEKVKPILDVFWSWLNTVDALAGSGLGKAVTYAHNQKGFLNAFLLDGRVAISNNRAENAIRPFVTGRKNWLFSDTPRGATASATVYSLVASAKANRLNVYMYLVHLLTELPKLDTLTSASLESFLPWSPNLPSWCKII
jgi:transposase